MITGVGILRRGRCDFPYDGFFLGGLDTAGFNSTLPSPTYFVTSVLVAMLIGLGFALIIGTVIAIESAVVALLLAPLSLLGRRLSPVQAERAWLKPSAGTQSFDRTVLEDRTTPA